MPSNETPSRTIFGASPSVRRAYREVLRYIHHHGLGNGDRLPSQAELRSDLELGNNVIGEAMQLLVSDGVLSRQRKAGTVINDTGRASQGVWTVAITQHGHEGMGFHAVLEYCLRKHLDAHGCEDKTFFRPAPPINRPHRLDDFHGLAEAVDAGIIDIIATTEHLKTDEPVLVFHLAAAPDSTFGIRADYDGMITQACGAMAMRGAGHIAWCTHSRQDYLGQQHERVIRAALQRSERLSLQWSLARYQGTSITGGRDLAQRLLAMPKADRPDALILGDDYVTMGLTDALRDQDAYRPLIATLSNQQVPLLFALPAMRLEIDTESVARRAAEMISQQLLNPGQPTRVERYQTQLKIDSGFEPAG